MMVRNDIKIYMKRILFFFLMLFTCVVINAQQSDDKEKDHVKVTLNDGRVVEGYIQTYWIEGKLFKRMNTSFKMSLTPYGKELVSYDADDVKSIDFVKPSDAGVKYDHLESMLVANPSVFKSGKVRRQFVYKEGENKIAKIYWWNGVDSQNMQLGKMNISTIYGICLNGEDVVVPFMTGNVISLNAMRIRYKKSHPGFVDFVDKRVLKGGKRYWDAIADNPMMFLEICDEFFSMQK